VIQGDIDATIFSLIALIILKLLRFKFVGEPFSAEGLDCLFHGNHGNQVIYCSKFV
jgi:hypothetical protein